MLLDHATESFLVVVDVCVVDESFVEWSFVTVGGDAGGNGECQLNRSVVAFTQGTQSRPAQSRFGVDVGVFRGQVLSKLTQRRLSLVVSSGVVNGPRHEWTS
eukprot:5402405-Amphidinium_carterae.4